jgi:hypothetical protein
MSVRVTSDRHSGYSIQQPLFRHVRTTSLSRTAMSLRRFSIFSSRASARSDPGGGRNDPSRAPTYRTRETAAPSYAHVPIDLTSPQDLQHRVGTWTAIVAGSPDIMSPDSITLLDESVISSQDAASVRETPTPPRPAPTGPRYGDKSHAF